MFYKSFMYTYPLNFFGLELAFVVFLSLLQFLRLFVGSKGNKTEHSGTTGIFILLSIITILATAYFTIAQTFVLFFEFIMGIINLVFGVLEFFIACFAAIEFKSLEN